MFHLLNNVLHSHRSRAAGRCSNSIAGTSLKVSGGDLRHGYGNAFADPEAPFIGYGCQGRGGTNQSFWSLVN